MDNGNKGKFIQKENPKTNYGILAFELHAWSLFPIITLCYIV
jgi:hypothetical protein